MSMQADQTFPTASSDRVSSAVQEMAIPPVCLRHILDWI